MIRYTVTIFLSALMLFAIQPMIARFIVPWYGGTAAVWTTCMMFFQLVLLLGYAYVHFMRLLFRPRAVLVVQALLVIAAIAVLRTEPNPEQRPTGGEDLAWGVVHLLTMTVGLPFFVLSTTGPLVQLWHNISHATDEKDHSTYRLYAVSNLGSMVALLTYPFLVEPYLSRQFQMFLWCLGFSVFGMFVCSSGIQTWKINAWLASANPRESKTGWLHFVKWIVWAMAPSILLLATTNLMCQEVGSIPMLWLLPLTLYLLSLIVCFERPSVYVRPIFVPLFFVLAIFGVLLVHVGNQASLTLQIVGFSAVGFLGFMVGHGELQRSKPPGSQLTLFYLALSLGGALGGVFVAILAPHWFRDFCEFHVGLLLTIGSAAVIWLVDWSQKENGSRAGVVLFGLMFTVTVTCVFCSLLFFLSPQLQPDVITARRNAYGIVTIREREGYRTMVNGRTDHGGQYVTESKQLDGIAYYMPGCGPDLAARALRAEVELALPAKRGQVDERRTRSTRKGLKIGVIGLGAGALSTLAKSEDKVVFYEINPAVVDLAWEQFTYLEWLGERGEVRVGDGRVQLERDLDAGHKRDFDVLVVDAFTSDAIPTHLLTEECFSHYWNHLAPNGFLVVHITNRFVDLRPVLMHHAQQAGISPILVNHRSDQGRSTRWVLLTANTTASQFAELVDAKSEWPRWITPKRWTDDFSSLVPLIDWSMSFELERATDRTVTNDKTESPRP